MWLAVTGRPRKFSWFSSAGHRQPTVSPPHTYSHVSHLPLLNILPSVSLFCPSHPVCEIIINPLVMALRSRKSAQGRFFFLVAHVLGSASWLNRARVRNLFHFKQDPLIAEAPSQITSIQSSESRLIGTRGRKSLLFISVPNIFFKSNSIVLLKKGLDTFFFFKYKIIFFFVLSMRPFM